MKNLFSALAVVAAVFLTQGVSASTGVPTDPRIVPVLKGGSSRGNEATDRTVLLAQAEPTPKRTPRKPRPIGQPNR